MIAQLNEKTPLRGHEPREGVRRNRDAFNISDDQPLFRILNAREVAKSPPEVPFLIPGILAECQNYCMISARKKCLKTTIALDMAISLATGRPFLDRFDVDKPARSLFMSCESGLPVLRETAARIARSKGLDLETIGDWLHICPSVPKICRQSHLKALERELVDRGVNVLFVDPAYKSMELKGRESSLIAFGEATDPALEMCQELGVTFVLLHHTTTKDWDHSRPSLGDSSWAGFAESARQWICLNRRKRYVPDSGHHDLWMHVGGSAGHGGDYIVTADEGSIGDEGGRRWATTVADDDGTPTSATKGDPKKWEQKIASYLRANPGSLKSAVQKGTKLSGTNFKVAWDAMKATGAIVATDGKLWSLAVGQ